MSTYSPSELLSKWKKSELSPEQAIGYLLQHVLDFGQRLIEIEKPGALWARQLEQPPVKPQGYSNCASRPALLCGRRKRPGRASYFEAGQELPF